MSKIITDIKYLRQISHVANLEYVKKEDLFSKLEDAIIRDNETIGLGLSAIQIGHPVRASIIRYEKLNLNMINPIIVEKEKLVAFYGEGCLSIPGNYITTKRYKTVTVKWINEKGIEKTGVFEDMEAYIVQHEIDHMDGILIYDRKWTKIGRNDKCSCGSDKKYKKCCGR